MSKPSTSGTGAVAPGNPQPVPLLLTLAGAAKRLGVSKYKIKQLGIEGKILAVADGARFLYNTRSLDDYAEGRVMHAPMSTRSVVQNEMQKAREKAARQRRKAA